MRAGNVVEALRLALASLAETPGDMATLKLAVNAAVRLRDWRTVVRVGEQFRAHHPDNMEAIHALAHAYFEIGDVEKSRSIYRVLVEANPNSAEHLSVYSRICLAAFDYEGATRALERAHSLAPPSAANLYALARLKLFLGALDEAEDLNAEAIRMDQNFSPAYAQYVSLRGGDVDNKIKARMEFLANDNNLPQEHRASLFLALGEISHHRKKYVEAMESFSRGNQISHAILSAEGLRYRQENYTRQRAREDQVFRVRPTKLEFAISQTTPVFVVGMPRSGTTLVESILAAHPDAYGAGELDRMPVIYRDVLAWAEKEGGKTLADATHEQLQTWRDQYVAGYPDVGHARVVIDKQPFNFMAVGLIKTLFPEAIIIHVRRNPVDTGFSIYRNDFGKAWPYAVSFDSIAHFYADYARTTAYWEKILGPAFPLFQYEKLIADFEAEAKRLVALCGLDWREECLAFDKVERPIATFSAAQVRRPLRKMICHAEHQYGDLLNPLINGLQRAGVDLETGAIKALVERG